MEAHWSKKRPDHLRPSLAMMAGGIGRIDNGSGIPDTDNVFNSGPSSTLIHHSTPAHNFTPVTPFTHIPPLTPAPHYAPAHFSASVPPSTPDPNF